MSERCTKIKCIIIIITHLANKFFVSTLNNLEALQWLVKRKIQTLVFSRRKVNRRTSLMAFINVVRNFNHWPDGKRNTIAAESGGKLLKNHKLQSLVSNAMLIAFFAELVMFKLNVLRDLIPAKETFIYCHSLRTAKSIYEPQTQLWTLAAILHSLVSAIDVRKRIKE